MFDAQLQSGTAPDVFRVDYGNLGVYSSQDQLLDLSSYFDDAAANAFIPAFWRAVQFDLPIIILSSRTDEAGIVRALELGADDYVTKPYSPRELVARIRAVLRRGNDVEEAPTSLFGPDVMPAFERVWALSGATLHVPPGRDGELRPLTRELRARGLALSAADALGALAVLRSFSRRFLRATAAFDVLLAPVTTMTPRPIGWFDADGDGAADFERNKAYAAFPALANVTGQPAVSLPLHWTAGGLPVGTMLVGRPADEVTLVSLASQLEDARPWSSRHPAVWGSGAG